MLNIQKFYADVQRALKHERANSPVYSGIGASKSVQNLFIAYSKDLGDISVQLGDYWFSSYIENSKQAQNEPTREHIDFLANLLCLLNGMFESDMDFLSADWEQIKSLIDCNADTLPIEVITGVMQVMVERKKV